MWESSTHDNITWQPRANFQPMRSFRRRLVQLTLFRTHRCCLLLLSTALLVCAAFSYTYLPLRWSCESSSKRLSHVYTYAYKCPSGCQRSWVPDDLRIALTERLFPVEFDQVASHQIEPYTRLKYVRDLHTKGRQRTNGAIDGLVCREVTGPRSEYNHTARSVY